MQKIFAIGDIHGRLDKLLSLMDKIPIKPACDTLVFIGDYIDRGSDGPAVVDFVLALKEQCPNLVCLCGNHEIMFLRYLDGIDEDLYVQNGGMATLRAYGISPSDSLKKRKAKIPLRHLRFMSPLSCSTKRKIIFLSTRGFVPVCPSPSRVRRISYGSVRNSWSPTTILESV